MYYDPPKCVSCLHVASAVQFDFVSALNIFVGHILFVFPYFRPNCFMKLRKHPYFWVGSTTPTTFFYWSTWPFPISKIKSNMNMFDAILVIVLVLIFFSNMYMIFCDNNRCRFIYISLFDWIISFGRQHFDIIKYSHCKYCFCYPYQSTTTMNDG